MAKQKYYAVKNGKIKGVYLTWKDCQSMVIGYPNAVYKSFEDPHEAMDFLVGEKTSVKKAKKLDKAEDIEDEVLNKDIDENYEFTIDKDTIEAYVDGSFDASQKKYGSGGVLIKNGKVIDSFSKEGKNLDSVSMRNVAGEIEASMYAMQYCVDNAYSKLVLYFDYNGIEKWCTGEWKANKKGTKNYKKFYDEISDKLEVKFVKVKAHTGIEYNEMADKLAKESIFGK
ncbi:reverse transcriptase-like protein [Peptostreptococcus russellii]|uniref:ribonuclease H1 domain-containing protein n=1 Tax=Peptostreptococcus russellii TaxID=215200 RepID=UPI0016298FF8|nr:ribonuclease H family protein [Peptostreptococcus russellii]MBC2577514.1 reverse transcriptase-like protein [Peptostreptococcus russellii]